MPTNAINDTGVKYLYDKLHGEIEPVAEAVSTDTATVEGNPINFTTLSAQTAKSTILSLEPIQDLHGYDKPWVGGAGKNKFNKDDSYNATNYRISTSTGNIYPATGYTASNYIEIKQNTSYVLQTSANFQSYFAWYDDNRSYLGGSGWTSGTAKTPPENAKYVRFDCQTSDIDTVMFEEGSSPTSYAPYENLCPISGRTEIGILGCGKNLISNLIQGTRNSSTGEIQASDSRVVSNYMQLADAQYIISASTNISGKTINVVYQEFTSNGDDTYSRTFDSGWQSVPYTIRPTISNLEVLSTLAFRFSDNSAITPSDITVQCEKGTTPTTYTHYLQSTNLTISFGQTVYGGTLDVENGVLSVETESIVKDGSNDETVVVIGTDNPNIKRILVELPSTSMVWNDPNAISGKIWSNEFTEITNQQGFAYLLSGIHYRANGSHEAIICPSNPIITDEASARTWLSNNPVQIIYTYATPTTIQLTPNTINLLKGVNNISTDGDKITLTYRDGSVATLNDVKLASENLEQQIADAQILTDTATGDKYILVVTNGVLSVEQISN